MAASANKEETRWFSQDQGCVSMSGYMCTFACMHAYTINR